MVDSQISAQPITIKMSLSATAQAQVFRPLPDDHPCYRLVGLIAAETARIERLVDQAISTVASLDLKDSASFTGQMIGPTPRFNALLQLARNRGLDGEILKKIELLSGHASAHFEQRNRAVHDAWLEDADTGKPHQFRGKARKSPSFGPEPVSEQELQDTLTALRKHRDAVNDLVSEIWMATVIG